eukprot:483446_1
MIDENRNDNSNSNDNDMIDENGDIKAIFMDEKIGANELDMEYNFIQGIRREELKRHSHSDFVKEFNDIHNEIEGLIQYDETIIHEKLRERKRKYEERRRKERAKREKEIETNKIINNNNIKNEKEILEEEEEEILDEEEHKLDDTNVEIPRFID